MSRSSRRTPATSTSTPAIVNPLKPQLGQPTGFARASKEKRQEAGRLGGKTRAQRGHGHQWTAEEAARAGAKGGSATGAARKAKRPSLADLALQGRSGVPKSKHRPQPPAR